MNVSRTNIVIPAAKNGTPGVYLEPGNGGIYFSCRKSTGTFYIQFDSQAQIEISAQSQIEQASGPTRSLTLLNNSGNDITVSYTWGTTGSAVTDVRNVVTTSGQAILIDDALTPEYDLTQTLTLANGGSIDLLAVRSIGSNDYQRVGFHITNTTSGKDLYLITLYGVAIGTPTNGRCIDFIRGGTERDFDDRYSGDYRLWNASGAQITLAITEFLLATPLPV